jgi:hypothetical protein
MRVLIKGIIMKTTLRILDEVNIQFTGLSPECRRALIKELEYFVPGAQFSPAVKLGRWNGKKSYFDLAGRSYLNLLDRLLPIVQQYGYEIEIDDQRKSTINFEFDEVVEDSYSHINWPKGHTIEGQPIMIKDHQVEAINAYLNNLAGISVLPTGSGKCLDFNTMIDIEIDENSDFGKFIINKLNQQAPGHDTTRNSNKY